MRSRKCSVTMTVPFDGTKILLIDGVVVNIVVNRADILAVSSFEGQDTDDSPFDVPYSVRFYNKSKRTCECA